MRHADNGCRLLETTSKLQPQVPEATTAACCSGVCNGNYFVQLTDDTNFERGSVVTQSFIFTNPPEE